MASSNPTPAANRLDPVAVVGLLLGFGAFVWSLIHLGSRSLWWDEEFTVALTAPYISDTEAAQMMATDVHPPFYYLSVRAWLHLLNRSDEFAVRAFNLFPYLVAVLVGLWGMRRRINAPVTLWFVLYICSFGFAWYLQEARMYGTVLSQSFAACLLIRDYESRRTQPMTPGYIALLTLVFSIIPVAHWMSFAFSGLLLIGLSIWALVERRWSHLAVFLCLGVLEGAIGLSWIIRHADANLGMIGTFGHHIYGGVITLWGVRTTIEGSLLFAFTLNPLLMLAALYGAWQLTMKQQRAPGLFVIFGACIALTAAIFGVSTISAMYQTRNFIWLTPPATLLAAIGLERLFQQVKFDRMRQAVSVAGIIAISFMIGPFAGKIYPLELDDWRHAAAFINRQPGCGAAHVYVLTEWLHPDSPPQWVKNAHRIYGYYGGDPDRFEPVRLGEQRPIDWTSPCHVALWAGQMTDQAAHDNARLMFGDDVARLKSVRFAGHTVFLRPDESTGGN